MAETVRVPGIGDVKKQHLYVALAIIAGIVGYAWWRSGTSGTVPAYTEDDVADPVTDTPGGPPGSPANSGGGHTDGSTMPDNDAEWTQQAVEALDGAFERDAILTALGLYITGQTLTDGQAIIVRAAIAVVGYPPGGRYPIKTGTGATPSALTEPTGLKVRSATADAITLEWKPVSGAAGYRIYRSGASQNVGHSIDGLAVVGGLQPNTSYTFHVRAVDAAGKTGPKSSSVTGKTAAAAKTPAPAPGGTPKPPSTGTPRYRTMRITKRGQTLSDLVAAYNKKYGTRHTWQAIWDFNLKYRSASTVKTLKKRGPHGVVLGSAFWFPY